MPPEFAADPPRQRLRRLPGRSPSLGMLRATPRARLWISDRELVQETVRSYTQEVQRFALGDIQAVQVRRTTRGMWYNGVLVALLCLVFLFTYSADGSTRSQLIVAGCLVLLLLILLFVNTLRGATCRTVLVTVLGPQRLFSLGRLRPARRALAAIIAGVDVVQGALHPDEAARLVDQAQAPQRPPVAPSPVSPP